MQILIIADSLNGGLGRLACEDATRLAARGHRVRLLSLAGPGEHRPSSEVLTAEVAAARATRRAQLTRLIKEAEWSVCHGPRAARCAGLKRGRKIQVDHGARSLPGTPTWRRAVQRLWGLASVRLFDHSLTVAPRRGHGWTTVWYDHTVDTDPPTGVDQASTSPVGPEVELVLLWVGRVSPQKDIAGLLRLADGLQAQGLRVESHIMGTLDPGTTLPPSIAPLVLHGHVRSPWATDIAQHPRAVFVLFSHFEGRPLAVEEAIRNGLPVLVCDLPGHRMMLGDDLSSAGRAIGEVGIVSDVASAVRFAQRLTDPVEREQVRREQQLRLDLARHRFPDAAEMLRSLIEGVDR